MMMRKPLGDHGAVAVLTALLSVLLLAIGALAVDLGNAYSRKRAVQTTADLAALAGGTQLPNAACALASAFRYMEKNGAQDDGDDVPAFTQLVDGDTGNGEIIVSASEGSVDLVEDALTTLGQVDSACETGDEGAAVIRVVAPPRRIEFGLAGVIGFSGVDVTAGATVALRTLGNIQPLGIPAGCDVAGFVEIKLSSLTETGCSASTGNFGFLDLHRQGVASGPTALFENLREGADHGYGRLVPLVPSEPPAATTTEPCGDDGTPAPFGGGTFLHDVELHFDERPNCVAIRTGVTAAALTDAFVRRNSESCARTGRLTRVEPHGKVRPFDPGGSGGSCQIEARRFSDHFVTKALTVEDVAAAGATGKLILNSITRSPAFFVVPVLYVDERPQNPGYYRISDFRGFYLDYSDAFCPSGAPTVSTQQPGPRPMQKFQVRAQQTPPGQGKKSPDPSPSPSATVSPSATASPTASASPSASSFTSASAIPSPTATSSGKGKGPGGGDPGGGPVEAACSPYQTNGSKVYDDKGQIVGMTGYSFDLDLIQHGPNTGKVADYYIGTGPAAPVLIRDPLN